MDPYVQVINSSVLGEGPHWDESKQELVYVDIQNNTGVHRFVPSTGEHTKVNISGMGSVSLVVPVEGEQNRYVISTGRTLNFLDWDGVSSTPTRVTPFLSVEPAFAGNRFNDGKCDSLGRLWAGTMAGAGVEGSANLYKINMNAISTMETNIDISNGLAWNAENTLMFYNDTATGRVDVFDYNHTSGTISNRRPVYNFATAGEAGSPDGMTIDANGLLYVGCWGGSQMIVIDPTTGQKVNTIRFPTANITSAAFGGPNLDVLYVTSASAGLSQIDLYGQPTAGCLFQVTNVGARGQSGGISYRT